MAAYPQFSRSPISSPKRDNSLVKVSIIVLLIPPLASQLWGPHGGHLLIHTIKSAFPCEKVLMFQNLNLKCHLCLEPQNLTEKQLCEVLFHFWEGLLRVKNLIPPQQYLPDSNRICIFFSLHRKLFSVIFSLYS